MMIWTHLAPTEIFRIGTDKNLSHLSLTHAFSHDCLFWGCVTGKVVDNGSVQSDHAHTPPGPSPAVFSKCVYYAIICLVYAYVQ